MAFEEVNVKLLKNSINNSLGAIDYTSSKEIIDKITNNDIWNTSSRDNFKKNLNTLVNIKYPKLEKKLNSFLSIANKIEEYQQLAKLNIENKELLNEIILKSKTMEIGEISNIDFSKKIEDLNKSILENETKMEVIINTINNNL